MENSAAWHFFKNLSLLILSFAFLPFDTAITAGAYLWTKLSSRQVRDEDPQAPDPLERVTVLITSVNMAKGLSLTKLFHRAGHRVIGADTYPLALGRVSSSVDTFYRLPQLSDPSSSGVTDRYLDCLLEIVQKEQVDLWISVSDVHAWMEDATVKEIMEARTGAKAIQLGVHDIRRLHEKDAFMEHTKNLGLNVPETETVRDKEDLIRFLRERGGLVRQPGGTQYLLKAIGIDDFARFELNPLPMDTESETLECIDSMPFGRSPDLSFIIQEYIEGQEYCTHALIIHGQVRAFVACPSSSVLLHYTALDADSPLSKAMLEFTMKQAEAGGHDYTGHVSFDFLVKGGSGGEKEEDIVLYPIECNPRVHTAVVLFNDTPELVDEYLSILHPSSTRPSQDQSPLTPRAPRQYYWIGQDFVELVLYPLYQALFRGTISLKEGYRSAMVFVHHVVNWKDGTFEVWDPIPWWWMYHVYWPLQFAEHLVRGRWSKLNASTGRMFKAK